MGAHVIGLFQWMATQFSPSTLAGFAARGLIVFALPAALFVSLAVTRTLPVHWYRNIRLWLCLGLAAPIEMEPVLAGPAVTGGSMTRLAMLAYLPVLLGLAIVLEQIPLPAAVQRRLVFVSAFTAAIGSFHHFYSFLGIPDPRRAGTFAGLPDIGGDAVRRRGRITADRCGADRAESRGRLAKVTGVVRPAI
jgi:hypothetical protein